MAFFRWHYPDRAHVVQSVGELDEHDAYVADHRQHHFLHIGRLLLGPRVEREVGQLGQAVDELGHGRAELRLQGSARDTGVFEDVVEESGDDAVGVERELGDGARDGQWMGDVGVAGQALLAFVGLGTECIGAPDRRERVRVHAGLEVRAEVVDRVRRVGAVRRSLRCNGLLGHRHGMRVPVVG
jgi:hypothetical protein